VEQGRQRFDPTSAPEGLRCRACGSELKQGARFCGACGAETSPHSSPPNQCPKVSGGFSSQWSGLCWLRPWEWGFSLSDRDVRQSLNRE
jgi:hypothetical protein